MAVPLGEYERVATKRNSVEFSRLALELTGAQEKLEEQLELLKSLVEKLTAENKTLATEVASLRGRANNLDQLNGRIVALETHFSPGGSFAVMQFEFNGRVPNLEVQFIPGGRVPNLEAHFDPGGTISKLDERISAIEARMNGLEANFSTGGKVTTLEERLKVLEEQSVHHGNLHRAWHAQFGPGGHTANLHAAWASQFGPEGQAHSRMASLEDQFAAGGRVTTLETRFNGHKHPLVRGRVSGKKNAISTDIADT